MEKIEKVIAQIERRDKVSAYLLKDLAGSLGALRTELLASYKMLDFSTDDMLIYFNAFIKAQELFEKLANNYVSMGWFTFYDAPKGWFEYAAGIRMMVGDDDNELGRLARSVITCYLKFTSTLLELNLSDF